MTNKLLKVLSKVAVPARGNSLIVRQGRHWSSAIIWITSGLFTTTIAWSILSRVDQTISTKGSLSPNTSVFDVRSPTSGTIESLFVRENQQVNIGTPLFKLSTIPLTVRQKSIKTNLSAVTAQISSLNAILSNPDAPLPSKPLISFSSSHTDQSLVAALNQSQLYLSQLRQVSLRANSKRKSLILQQSILESLKPAFSQGGISRNQYLQQQNSIQEYESDVLSLDAERARILGQISAQVNALNREKSTLQSDLATVTSLIQDSSVVSPASGSVFDLAFSQGSYVSQGQSLLKIVPNGPLLANVSVSNRDIGFIKKGMSAQISVDSFPSGEFGYINGIVTSVGSDALPPDKNSQSSYFPVVITLKQQKVVAGTNLLNLQSGMSVTAHIKLRSRPALSILSDIFTKQLDGVKTFR